MFRIDVTTAAGTLPAPAAAGTPGYFTNGNPGLGIAATVVNYDWLNGMQEELMALLNATSITPTKTNYTQVMQAILAAGLVSDVGTPNVLVANPVVPLTTLPVGTRLTLIPLNTNTGTSTLNVSSLGAVSILRPDGNTLQAGDLPAGRRLPIIYDGSAWRLLNWPVRQRLGGNLMLFCNPQTGNDNNNGLTIGNALASLQAVWNWLYLNIDTTGYTVTVQCSGTYTVGLNAQTVIVGSTPQSIVFNFAGGSTISITSGSAFQATNPGVGYTVTGPVVITATGTNAGFPYGSILGYGIVANGDAQIQFSGVNFGACGTGHVLGQYGGQVTATGNYTISGSAPNSLFTASGQILMYGITVTLTGTPAFSSAYMLSGWAGGQITALNMTYTGSATGNKYLAQYNGVIWTNGTLTSIPGSVAGTTTNGGVAA